MCREGHRRQEMNFFGFPNFRLVELVAVILIFCFTLMIIFVIVISQFGRFLKLVLAGDQFC